MLQTGECKFSIARETLELWKRLQNEGREKEFQQLFWRTEQGTIVTQTLRRRGIKVASVNVEKRPEDSLEYLYIKTKL